MTRRWPAPDPNRTVHAIGDLHFSSAGGGIDSSRPPIVTASILKATCPTAAATIHTGDCGTNSLVAEDAQFDAWIAGLGAKAAPFYGAPGNHDILTRTVADAEASLGFLQTPYAVDLGFVVAIAFIPGEAADGNGTQFSPTRLAALDALIGAQTKPVWLFNHFPLYGTVGALADGAVAFRSIDNGFYACTNAVTTDSSEVLAMLADHPNVKAWIAGHTHSNLGTDGLVTTVTTGGVTFASINTSALASVDKVTAGQGRYSFGPLNTLFITSVDDKTLEVRYRAHAGGGYWTTRGVGGEMVTTVSLP